MDAENASGFKRMKKGTEQPVRFQNMLHTMGTHNVFVTARAILERINGSVVDLNVGRSSRFDGLGVSLFLPPAIQGSTQKRRLDRSRSPFQPYLHPAALRVNRIREHRAGNLQPLVHPSRVGNFTSRVTAKRLASQTISLPRLMGRLPRQNEIHTDVCSFLASFPRRLPHHDLQETSCTASNA